MHGARPLGSRLAPRRIFTMLTDSLFSDASWLFFAIWGIAVITVSIAAFGPDLLRSMAPATSSQRTPTQPNRTHNTGRI